MTTTPAPLGAKFTGAATVGTFDSPVDFVIVALVLAAAWVLVSALRRRAVRSDRRRRTHTMAALAQESAAFAARWAGPGLSQAPVGELAAEYARNGRLLALLDRHRATARDAAERQQATDEIAAVQRWLMALPPCPPDVTSQPPVACSTGPGRAPSQPVAGTSALIGFPLGEPVVLFCGQPDRVRDVCLVRAPSGRHLAVIRPRGAVSVALSGRSEVEFEVVRPDGSPVLYLRRCAGATQRWEAFDPAVGAVVASLEQTNPWWHTIGTQRMTFAVGSAGRQLGCVQVRQRVRSRSVHAGEAVLDTAGRQVALVEPLVRDPSRIYSPNFDFTLSCPRPLPPPFPQVLLLAGFSHFFYALSWR